MQPEMVRRRGRESKVPLAEELVLLGSGLLEQRRLKQQKRCLMVAKLEFVMLVFAKP